ncbi:rod shape-determining protein MreD [Sporolactobacillus sp. THM7-4]|nr:rod shape-determining protein MreD [Sporolactobacillus sp. THM7-4]
MRQLKLFLFLFLLFLFQGTVMVHFSLNNMWGKVQMVPDFLLVACLMVSFFADMKTGLQYAILFGFLIDLVYTSVIGVYAFSLGLAVYLVYSLSKFFNMNAATVLMLSLIGVFLLQTEVYVIYSVIGLIRQPLSGFLQWRLPATLALNGAFTLIIYYPFRSFLRKMSEFEVQ